MYAIKDNEGNFTNQHGYRQDGNGHWRYVFYTGRCDGMRYYISESLANEMLNELVNKAKTLNDCRIFKIILVDTDKLPFGTKITKSI
jgi:hypothetical protein